MLQQTTVQAVLPYYAEWLSRYPDVESLSRAPLKKILKSWQGLGYYQRARNLQAAARVLVRDFGGRIPQDFETLRKLPGFGPYTAAAVLSLAEIKKMVREMLKKNQPYLSTFKKIDI